MLATGGNFWTEWELAEKVEFDGLNRLIIVHPLVTSLSIREDVYSAWVRWREIRSRGNDRWPLAMEFSGFDATPLGESGGTFFTRNNWKLVVDITKVKIKDVLFSRDFDTAYYSADLVAVNPVEVALVTSTSQVESSAPTAEEISLTVWSDTVRTLTEGAGLTLEEKEVLAKLYDRFDMNASKPNTYADDGSTIANGEYTLTKTSNGDGTSTVQRS